MLASSGLLARWLVFAEETAAAPPVSRQMGSAEKMVRDSRLVLRYQREGARTVRVGCGAAIEPHLAVPILGEVNHPEVMIVTVGVGMAGCIPIRVGEQTVAEDAHVAHRDAKSLAPAWIARRRGVANQHNSVTVRMIDPVVGGNERRQ